MSSLALIKSKYSLNPCFNGRYSQSFGIIIKHSERRGLNPCFNGRYSQRPRRQMAELWFRRLNPCFNGRYSQSSVEDPEGLKEITVLILVLMEDTLRDKKKFGSKIQKTY